MAKDTPSSFRNLVIYECYVRNHGPHGTFSDVEADLERIRALGVDILWFMPIHPIGKLNKKGSLGCPYSIVNYSEVNPEYGTKDDFARLIEKAHAMGLKIMIDVVYNHTAHDSVLVKDHPDWYHQDASGKPVTTVPEWSDVIDLKHPNADLSAYLIETLQGWAKFGVDGFRCDVASLLPEAFWVEARQAVAQVKPGVIWLAESVHAAFVEHRRKKNLSAISDSEVHRGFDMTYDYDIFTIWQAAVEGKQPVARYLEMLRFQEAIYPANFIKMRCVENHDQKRIMDLAPTREQALAWTAFEAFNRGSFLIYGGQESAASHTPSLFDIDKVEWKNYELALFLTTLAKLKKEPALKTGVFTITSDEPVIQAVWENPGDNLVGVFNVRGAAGSTRASIPDGTYQELLGGGSVTIRNGQVNLPATAIILRVPGILAEQHPFHADLLDYHSA
ncbi:MAG TPA: alpha-amylase family glycosyl hydrolase [Anaerolineaceae bacterium]|nr:alpha-amylase family glycosyl hydrolase [Anaerolineaceae bacterium]